VEKPGGGNEGWREFLCNVRHFRGMRVVYLQSYSSTVVQRRILNF
jgi:hypothetical protein